MAFVALIDANVLYGAALRDTVVRAALADLYRPAWSADILAEMVHSIRRERPDLAPERIERTAPLMRDWLPEALVDGYQALASTMTNDPGDRHVLAAAVRAGAHVIVTFNLRHFPPEACEPYGIEAQHPDEFLCHLWDLSPETMAMVLQRQALPLRDPPKTPAEVVRDMAAQVPDFATMALASGLL
jgi:predicted nucleic acid-binding protein